MKKDCIIDGKDIKNKKDLHRRLKEGLEFSHYYGSNLDALWDEITSSKKERRVIIKNREELLCSLGEYGKSFLSTLFELDREVSNFDFIIVKEGDKDGTCE